LLDQAGPHLTQIAKDFEGLATREPQNAKAQLLLAKALLANDSRDPNADAILRRSIALDPNDWESHYELGILFSNRHAYREAATELERSIELDPKQPSPHYHLARVYDRLGQPDRAKAEREIHQRLTAPAGQ
jgi:predicted Zn-dependent protease